MGAGISESSESSFQTATHSSRELSYIPILDGWRAVAILLVVFFHGLYNSDKGSNNSLDPLTALFGRLGALGVLIFFTISGYLITQKLVAEFRATGMFSVRSFYIRRIFRILPPLALYLLVLVLLFASGLLTLRTRDWSAVIFLTNYYPGSWYTAHFWSLAVEEHFYLFWPICILVAGWRRAMWIGVLIVCAVAVWRPWELHRVASEMRALQHTDMRVDYIMMGCVAALMIDFYPAAKRSLIAVGSTAGVLCLTLLLLLITRHPSFDVRSIEAVILTLMVCGSANANPKLLSRIIANPAMLFVGRISYSLYIWQELFLAPSSNPHIRSPYALLVKIPLTFLVACASFYLVEKPFIAIGRGLTKKKPDVPGLRGDLTRAAG